MSEENKEKNRRPQIVLLAIVLAIGGWLGHRWWYGLSHVSTDNAQIEGDVIPVAPKVGGLVAEVAVRDHQPVRQGDLLVRIQERDYEAKLVQAEAELQLALANAGKEGLDGLAAAQLAASRSSAAAARASAAAARSAVDQALAEAERAGKDLVRVKALVDKKMLTPQQLDLAESTSRAADARVRSAREAAAAAGDSATSAGQQVTAGSANLRAALARAEAARAARDFAANQLADTRLLAPATGVVAAKNVNAGQFVQPGQPLLSVVPLDRIWIVANFKETDLADMRVGQKAEIEVDSYPGLKVEGVVESLSPATGARFSLLPPDNATGNFTKVVQRLPVRIAVKQSADAARPLRPGMSVYVTVATR